MIKKNEQSSGEEKSNIAEIKEEVKWFIELDFRPESVDIEDVYDRYENLSNKIMNARMEEAECEELYSELVEQQAILEYHFGQATQAATRYFSKKVDLLEDSITKSQGVQLATFSIVISILAFILTNANILSAKDIDFKNVLLVNLGYLLSVFVLFAMVYFFLGLHKANKYKKTTAATFIIIPILLLSAISIIAILMP